MAAMAAPKTTTAKTAAFITLGCKINQYETEAIREQVLELGYREVDPAAVADVYVVNTCSVTAMAGAKSRKAVLRVARRNPRARVVVVGCSTAAEREKIAGIPQVALVAGNEEKAVVASFIEGGWRPGDPFPERDADILGLDIARYTDRTRATIKVQDGCNSFCSFCIIPHLRGTSRSRHPDAVLEEVRRLVDHGFLEVVISGIHLQDYGADLSPRLGLVDLLDRISSVPGLARLRLSSLGPRAFTPELLELLSRPVFCRHWHIPLQSGSDAVLEAMRRGYSVEDFELVARELGSRFADAAITTDVIVGHPGETPERFEETVAVSRRVGFARMHIFPFSFREGTLSAKLWASDPVPPVEIRRRVEALALVEEELGRAYRARFLGRELEVLVEGTAHGDGGDDLLQGLTDRYVRVCFPLPSPFAAQRFPGTLQTVRAVAAVSDGLAGLWCEEPRDVAEVAGEDS